MDRLISEKQIIDTIKTWAIPLQISNTESTQDFWVEDVCRLIKAIPSAEPKKCKDCKWWRDSDGAYRRGVKAESRCPINTVSVANGWGYCYMFEPQESEDKGSK